jgi:glutaminyl-peptide cyclotransferase
MSFFTRKRVFFAAMVLLIFWILKNNITFNTSKPSSEKSINTEFDGEQALQLIKEQVGFGDRSPNTEGQRKMQEFITHHLQKAEMKVHVQPFEHKSSKGSFKMANVVGEYKPESEKRILLGAHYDTKRFTSMDRLKKDEAVVGANDGASGVAVLLQLAYLMHTSENPPDIGIDFVFFDGEEAEDLKDGEWEPLGSTYFASHLEELYDNTKPQEGIILDMVCDKDLEIYRERNSDRYAKKQNDAFFKIASEAYPSDFKNTTKWSIEDDHMPLNHAGIPTIDIIDFDYPHWHTTGDTIDKCSSESLEKVGDVVWQYLLSL